jgi:hypothetical protein
MQRVGFKANLFALWLAAWYEVTRQLICITSGACVGVRFVSVVVDGLVGCCVLPNPCSSLRSMLPCQLPLCLLLSSRFLSFPSQGTTVLAKLSHGCVGGLLQVLL